MKSTNWFIHTFLVLIPFIALNIIATQCGKHREKQEAYSGVLIDIFNDSSNRNQTTYKIQTSSGIINSTIRSYPESYDYAEVGDSICKIKGQLQITVFKKKYNFSKMTSFPYAN